MSGATVSPSLPAMKQQFESAIPFQGGFANADPDLRTTLVKLVITLPALFIVIGSPIAGIVVDKFGRKPLLLITAVLYGFAGSSGLFLESLPAILVGRAVLGLAVAGVMVSATTLIADYYSGPARAAFMGLQAGFMGLGGVVFLTLGGALAQQNWHYPFLSPIVTQPLTKSIGLGGTYALVGGGLVIVALGFAVFKSQVRNLTRSRAV